MVPPTEPCALRSTQPLKVSTRDFSWGKGGRCVWLTTYHPCSAETSRKSGALNYPEPLGPPRPVAGHLYFLLLYYITLYYIWGKCFLATPFHSFRYQYPFLKNISYCIFLYILFYVNSLLMTLVLAETHRYITKPSYFNWQQKCWIANFEINVLSSQCDKIL